MTIKGFLGIDAGTQGLSVIFTNQDLQVLAVGEGDYEMVPGLDEGCYEQFPDDWEKALAKAMESLRNELKDQQSDFEVLSIGISGQMHGEVLADEKGNSLGPARLWCDSRNGSEEAELTRLFDTKMPKRMTAVRWLWTLRNRPELARQARHMTTPSGWIANRLTGEWNLGIGDAAGMFPMDPDSLDYNKGLLKSFNQLTADLSDVSLADLLPKVKKAGEQSGSLVESGAKLLGLPAGIPVAAAEGDQPAALAGSLIGNAGMVSVSFGTSVCANSVGDRGFNGVSPAVDHFCAADGKPINMVWLRNGTTYMNSIVSMFTTEHDENEGDVFARVMPQVLNANPACGGIVALPFMDDEPGLGVNRGGSACLVGLNATNATAGNAVKAAMLATMFNLKIGSKVLDEQGFPRTELILSGGLTRTPELGQVLADVFDTPVCLLDSSDEGTAWGAALLAAYLHRTQSGAGGTWAEFLASRKNEKATRFDPDADRVAEYERVFNRYRQLLNAQPALDF